MKLTTTSLEGTQRLGEKLGEKLRGDETIALVGELGAGKTAFVQGLAKGMGAKTHVISPTFVLERIYDGTKKRVVHHFDIYRIKPSEVDSTGLLEIIEEATGPEEPLTRRGVVVIEWADKIKKLLPSDTIWVEIKTLSETKRELNIHIPETRKYLDLSR